MLDIEDRLGRRLEEWLADAYATRTQREIAAELGIEESTVSRWMASLGVTARFPGQRPPKEAVA